ncbi:TIGR04282 family arsenosugar biosynthesis glycosyltransferase [Novispirillum itersonii]|uniref:TIGR04282 family arsenosugar biosynthesis glycosyltransferase n=1 Tax=Novispirillum itersonii TaxID=189 RepID=UPI000365EC3E|nr:DUF2064 domain-containing protein [Novispirillum itersonii]
MNDTPSLILFGRRPRYGAGKSRLARRIGALAALRFQQGQLTVLLHRFSRDRRWITRLCLTPTPESLRLPSGLPCHRVPQGRGDLGQRMLHALRTAPGRGPVVLIGTDIPAVTPDHIAAALRALRQADLVFGPAEDGGYWLIGWSRRRPLPPQALRGVRWSTPQALTDSLHSLGPHLRIARGAILPDVDF